MKTYCISRDRGEFRFEVLEAENEEEMNNLIEEGTGSPYSSEWYLDEQELQDFFRVMLKAYQDEGLKLVNLSGVSPEKLEEAEADLVNEEMEVKADLKRKELSKEEADYLDEGYDREKDDEGTE